MDAMREVFSAVIVIGIVLVAVFVPVAFFPGTTGRMYQQFSLTIAFSVVLSVFNAVTFTPALSALLLEAPQGRRKAGSSRGSNWMIDGGTNLLRADRSAGCLRWELAMLAVFAVGAVGDLGDLSSRAVVVRAGRGRGLLHRDYPGAGRVVARIHDESSRSRPSKSS